MRLMSLGLTTAIALTALSGSLHAQQAPAPASDPLAPAKATAPRKAAGLPRVGPFSLATRSATPAAANATGKEIDDSALRYYASQNDTARVAAEIKRLRTLYPAWKPPADLMEESARPQDEQPLWDLFATGALDEVNQRIADLQAQNPSWQPSADLAEKLRLAAARRDLVAASDAKDWAGTLEAAGRAEGLLTCQDVDAMWRVAEALAGTGDIAGAAAAYRYVVANCSNPTERLATVQKASLVLPGKDLDGLIALGRRGSDGAGEFESVRLDAQRRRIGEAIAGSVDAPTQAELDAFERAARRSKSAADLELLGWLAYSKKAWPQAEAMFRSAMAIAPSDAKAAEGLSLALRDGGKLPEAEETAWANRALGPLVRKAFIEIVSAQLTAVPRPVLPPERIARLAETVEGEHSALGAQSLGWYVFNAGDVKQAFDWFRKSVDWAPSEEGAIGLAVSAQRLKNIPEFRAAVARFGATYPKVAELAKTQPVVKSAKGGGKKGPPANPQAIALANEAVVLFKAGKFREAIDTLDQRRSVAPEPRDLSVLRGWALLKAGEQDGAKRLFSKLDETDSTPESREGLREIEAKEYEKQTLYRFR